MHITKFVTSCSDRKRRKKQHLDGQSDISGSLRISDGTEDQAKEGKITTETEIMLNKILLIATNVFVCKAKDLFFLFHFLISSAFF